jgi:hypothetical protein
MDRCAASMEQKVLRNPQGTVISQSATDEFLRQEQQRIGMMLRPALFAGAQDFEGMTENMDRVDKG